MAIVGFIFLLLFSIYLLVGGFVAAITAASLGGRWTMECYFMLGLSAVGGMLLYTSFIHAPFTITFS